MNVLVLLLTVLLSFIKTSFGQVTVCKSFTADTDTPDVNDIKCDSAIIFQENNIEQKVEDKNIYKQNGSSQLNQKEIQEIQEKISELSKIGNNLTSEMGTFQLDFLYVMKFIEDLKQCGTMCEQGKCLNKNSTFVCFCTTGYTGKYCNEISCDDQPCGNNSRCTGPNQCTCDDGYKLVNDQCQASLISSSSGPVVATGMKGDKGERGECSCNRSEIEDLKQTLQDTMARLNFAFSHKSEFCFAGVKNSRIPNSAMTASSFWNNGLKAHYGRLDSSTFWHPAGGMYSKAWLQVDFGQEKRVYGLVTQGRPSTGFNDFVTSYKILSRNSSTNLEMINSRQNEGVFQGNRDRNSHVVNYFPSPVTARYFRLVVVTYNDNPSLRIEYLLC